MDCYGRAEVARAHGSLTLRFLRNLHTLGPGGPFPGPGKRRRSWIARGVAAPPSSNPWFVLGDVCAALGLSNPSQAWLCSAGHSAYIDGG
jgi:hypothetical protein